jgi:integrase/recombinase XerD
MVGGEAAMEIRILSKHGKGVREIAREVGVSRNTVRRCSPYVITTERAGKTSAAAVVNLFAGWYRSLGFTGCSSHSGRRTFVTNAARRISTVGGSLRDVQLLAGHSALSTTQRYIDADALAQRKVVELV